MMDDAKALAALGALAQETRLRVFRLLVGVGPDGLAAGEIARRASVPAATLSFHLKELDRSGLLTSHRESRQVIYRVDFSAMRGLVDFLVQDCCNGHPEVCGIALQACKAAVEPAAG